MRTGQSLQAKRLTLKVYVPNLIHQEIFVSNILQVHLLLEPPLPHENDFF